LTNEASDQRQKSLFSLTALLARTLLLFRVFSLFGFYYDDPDPRTPYGGLKRFNVVTHPSPLQALFCKSWALFGLVTTLHAKHAHFSGTRVLRSEVPLDHYFTDQ
jgi:hypothetical protein